MLGLIAPLAAPGAGNTSQALMTSAQLEGPPGKSANSPAQPPEEVRIDQTTVARRVPPKAGDVCMECNHRITAHDVVFLANNHRIPIHRNELAHDLRAQLTRLLAQFQPRGAFLGAQQEQPALSRAWFLVGLYVLVGLVFAALCAHRALHSGHRPVFWFSVGLALNLLGYLLLLARKKREVLAPAGVPRGLRKISSTYAPEPCAKCGALNHPSASACIGCGAKLEPRVASEVSRAGLRGT